MHMHMHMHTLHGYCTHGAVQALIRWHGLSTSIAIQAVFAVAWPLKVCGPSHYFDRSQICCSARLLYHRDFDQAPCKSQCDNVLATCSSKRAVAAYTLARKIDISSPWFQCIIGARQPAHQSVFNGHGDKAGCCTQRAV